MARHSGALRARSYMLRARGALLPFLDPIIKIHTRNLVTRFQEPRHTPSVTAWGRRSEELLCVPLVCLQQSRPLRYACNGVY
eukprot:1157578-Pelagomonas_calceolata.AAC.6